MQRGAKDTTHRQASGRAAEGLAADFLMQKGLNIVERNFRVRGGEIDLICRDGKRLVFVEVRLRSHAEFGGAAASITAQKRRRLILAANHYLLRHPAADCRFDCILLDRLEAAAIEWIPNAFGADD
jgi:putative endonuclease